jgi:hypothetical protein
MLGTLVRPGASRKIPTGARNAALRCVAMKVGGRGFGFDADARRSDLMGGLAGVEKSMLNC